MDVVFFIYGLAFLAMGLVILIRHPGESRLEIANTLWLLAGFGFSHGFLELTDLWRIVRGDNPALAVSRPLILLASYLFLFEFGRRLTSIALPAPARQTAWSRLLHPAIHAPLLIAIALGTAAGDDRWAAMALLSRYCYGFTGAALGGLGFLLYWRYSLRNTTPPRDRHVISIASGAASAAFIAYAVLGGLVVPRASWFPASVVNQENFLALLGVPVQLARAGCAVLAAIAVGTLLRIFHLEGIARLREALDTTNRTLADLRILSRRNELILRSAADGIFGTDLEGRTTFVNEAALRMLGFERSELIGKPIHDLTHHTTAAGHALPAHACEIQRTMRNHALRRVSDDVFWRKDGSSFPVEYMSGPLWDGDAVMGVVVAFQDISERKRAEEELRIAAIAFESQEGVLITDANNVIRRVNRAFSEITGYSADEVVGRTPSMFKSGRHDQAFYSTLWGELMRGGVWQGEVWNRRKNGEVYPEWLTINVVRGKEGEITHHVAMITDISQRKAAEDEIRHLAFYDPLTRLPNRRLLMERLNRARAAGSRSGHWGALLFIDLDNFKTLNDTLGHDKGDVLLEQVAYRLSGCVREDDTVARFGGDEFVVMLEGLSGNAEEAASQTRVVGEKILAALNQSYQIAGHSHHSTSSIGATLFSGQKDTAEELLKQADMAMYKAKDAGRNVLRFFDLSMQAVVSARAALEADMRQGITRGEFVLYYQPQVCGENRLAGYEALTRWRHPTRGLVPPGDFIPLAEETGLILPLGRWVLEAACAQLVAWAGAPAPLHCSVAVNISARQFRQPDFARQVLEILAETGADPKRLKLELTESLLLHDMEDIISKMAFLKAHGVGFALDDFGTGYSSLSYLKRLPLDQLKIDQSFVRDILTDNSDAAIARTILSLGRSLGLAVIAEGVETQAQRDFLAELGCLSFQGYLFGYPMPAAPAPVREARLAVID